MSKIRILAADVDGTLTPKGQNLMPKTREALNRLHAEGVLIGPASGRPLDGMIINKWKDWGLDFSFDFAIGMNGGDLWTKESDTIEHFYQLQPEDIKQITGFCWDLDLNVIIYENAYAHVKAKRKDELLKASMERNHSNVELVEKENMWLHGTGKIECQMQVSEKEKLMALVKENQRDSWLCVKTYEDDEVCSIEFMDPRIHKGVALEDYVNRMCIPMEDVWAFGDNDNDIGMLKTAGFSVCLKNGSKATKAVADAITDYSVNEDGFGRYLFDHYFI